MAVALRDSQRSADGKQTRKQQCGGKSKRERVRGREGKRQTKVKSKTVKNVGLDDGNWH